MASVTVDVDPEDFIDEIGTADLIQELSKRKLETTHRSAIQAILCKPSSVVGFEDPETQNRRAWDWILRAIRGSKEPPPIQVRDLVADQTGQIV